MKVCFVIGTRPETIKLSPLIRQFLKDEMFEVNICFTGQHQDMVIPILDFFKLEIDINLFAMPLSPDLCEIVGHMFIAIGKYIKSTAPDLIFVQGDTTTAMVAATVAFYEKIEIAHIEAGLRTFDINAPFPEEFNRSVISKIAKYHFAPTIAAQNNLLVENISIEHILVTGNTGIDALKQTLDLLKNISLPDSKPWLSGNKKIILITCHRRENYGKNIENIGKAILELAVKFPEINFVLPLHLNPKVRMPLKALLKGNANIYLIEPLNYFEFVALMNKSYLILTDSGGVQEEAPTVKKPVLILRDKTERQEATDFGTSKLIGTNSKHIVENTTALITDDKAYNKMIKDHNPFGDGNASLRIHKYIRDQFLIKKAQ